MSMHIHREIESIKKSILSQGAIVEESVILAVKSLTGKNSELAESVRLQDRIIDQREVDLEEECLKILALHQPVAIDLRFIVAVLKMNNDLERIGDLAVNIAFRAEFLVGFPSFQIPSRLVDMSGKTLEMLGHALDALINLDVKKAHEVCKSDDIVDDYHRDMLDYATRHITESPENSALFVRLYEVSHQLERIADLATNIAEDVIYMVEGRIVRHSG